MPSPVTAQPELISEAQVDGRAMHGRCDTPGVRRFFFTDPVALRIFHEANSGKLDPSALPSYLRPIRRSSETARNDLPSRVDLVELPEPSSPSLIASRDPGAPEALKGVPPAGRSDVRADGPLPAASAAISTKPTARPEEPVEMFAAELPGPQKLGLFPRPPSSSSVAAASLVPTPLATAPLTAHQLAKGSNASGDLALVSATASAPFPSAATLCPAPDSTVAMSGPAEWVTMLQPLTAHVTAAATATATVAATAAAVTISSHVGWPAEPHTMQAAAPRFPGTTPQEASCTAASAPPWAQGLAAVPYPSATPVTQIQLAEMHHHQTLLPAATLSLANAPSPAPSASLPSVQPPAPMSQRNATSCAQIAVGAGVPPKAISDSGATAAAAGAAAAALEACFVPHRCNDHGHRDLRIRAVAAIAMSRAWDACVQHHRQESPQGQGQADGGQPGNSVASSEATGASSSGSDVSAPTLRQLVQFGWTTAELDDFYRRCFPPYPPGRMTYDTVSIMYEKIAQGITARGLRSHPGTRSAEVVMAPCESWGGKRVEVMEQLLRVLGPLEEEARRRGEGLGAAERQHTVQMRRGHVMACERGNAVTGEPAAATADSTGKPGTLPWYLREICHRIRMYLRMIMREAMMAKEPKPVPLEAALRGLRSVARVQLDPETLAALGVKSAESLLGSMSDVVDVRQCGGEDGGEGDVVLLPSSRLRDEMPHNKGLHKLCSSGGKNNIAAAEPAVATTVAKVVTASAAAPPPPLSRLLPPPVQQQQKGLHERQRRDEDHVVATVAAAQPKASTAVKMEPEQRVCNYWQLPSIFPDQSDDIWGSPDVTKGPLQLQQPASSGRSSGSVGGSATLAGQKRPHEACVAYGSCCTEQPTAPQAALSEAAVAAAWRDVLGSCYLSGGSGSSDSDDSDSNYNRSTKGISGVLRSRGSRAWELPGPAVVKESPSRGGAKRPYHELPPHLQPRPQGTGRSLKPAHPAPAQNHPKQ